MGLLHNICHLPKAAPKIQILGALLIGGLFLVGGLASGIAFITMPEMQWPHWYQLPVAVLIFVAPIGVALVGGKIVFSAVSALRH